MDNLVRISGDVFDIADRLKEIDGGYYPVYNLTRKRYEVHHDGAKNSLQVVIPYDSLDSRTIDKVRQTRREYVENMIREMDKNNELLKQKEEKERREKAYTLIDNTLSEIGRRS